MAQIIWTEEASRWLEDIYSYIAADNPAAASRTVEGIYDRAQDLLTYPEIGYHYVPAQRNVRIILYGHYRIAYLVKDNRDVDILRSLSWVPRNLSPSTLARYLTGRSTGRAPAVLVSSIARAARAG
jgi:toxin ParE1/3/4